MRFVKKNNNKGVTVIIFVVLIMMIIGFLMIQRMTTAVRKSRMTMRLFNSNYAMNLAESAVAAASNIMREKMNHESGENGDFYLEFRSDRSSLSSMAPIDMSGEPVIKEIAEKFDGKITRLDVSFKAIEPIKNNSGASVSIDNIEKCGVVEFVCDAEYKDATVQVITRQEFKVVIMKSHFFHNYVMMIRDAWDEYKNKPSTKYADYKYCQKPGSFECYNPTDHYLKVVSIFDPNYGRINFGGCGLDPDKKIILNLSDDDYDLMEPLPELKKGSRPATNRRFSSKDCYYSTTASKNLEKKEAETVFRSIFGKSIFPSGSKYDPFGPKSKIYIQVLNKGYKSSFKFGGKRFGTMVPPDLGDFLKNISDSKKWKNLKFQLGTPTFFYESAEKEYARKLGYNEELWLHHRDDPKRGIDLWGDRGLRVPTPVEGNVYARHITIGTMIWKVGSDKMYLNMPGWFDPVPLNDTRIAPDLGIFSAIWGAYQGSKVVTAFDTPLSDFPARKFVQNSSKTINRCFNTEVHLYP